ncbi:PREDICTED: pleckstrin homology domain-containing family O member 2 isoform X2 [Condylura cristata]|uniref:pleckstrin homology domain-containing family O member 2 isoform X2 n=1 Tax=Condylura cristata TaxID=143302 RepID=UPI0006430227|nr:PREDICTED: pleckstrin homology domain-containing family O member 2 isoform X2 [Condylura cristata]
MEEEGIKEGGEKPRGTRTADKAGWIKKSSGGLLGLWKDRYLLLCQAQLLVYDNEDEQKCVETVELGCYEKCQDLRALFKRKHRFILLRSPGNKVKVDKTCALEHVTRDRVRGGQRRRPPTRVHLKEVASAASDGLSRLDLDVPDSGPPVFVPSNDVRATQPREIPRPPMPPTKPSPVPETTNLGDNLCSAGERAPTPAPASSEAHSEGREDSETPVGEDSSEQPFKAVLPDKQKVSWENPSPQEPFDHESAAPSHGLCSDTAEAAPKESGKPPTPPPKILSDKLRASIRGMEASGPAPRTRTSETSALSPAQVSVNGVDDAPETAKPSQATGTPGTPPEDAEKSTALPFRDMPPRFRPRCSSLGDLLGKSPRRPRQTGEQLYRAHLEVKVASEHTEKLLNKVLGSEPAPVNAETLLSQAVEQLRQATQALQEIRDRGELGQEAPGLREKRKELVTLYRRSAP